MLIRRVCTNCKDPFVRSVKKMSEMPKPDLCWAVSCQSKAGKRNNSQSIKTGEKLKLPTQKDYKKPSVSIPKIAIDFDHAAPVTFRLAGKKWTPEEDQILRDLYMEKKPTPEIASHLSRSIPSIHTRIRDLKLFAERNASVVA